MLLLANVDDVSGELIPHAIDGCMARGACSVHAVQAITKKGRMEYLFFIDVEPELVDTVAGYLALELGTLGVRVLEPRHIKFAYRFCRVGLRTPSDEGPRLIVRVKQLLGDDGQEISIKAELEDLRRSLAELTPLEPRLSLRGLKRLVEQVVEDRSDHRFWSVQAEYLGGLEDEKNPASIG